MQIKNKYKSIHSKEEKYIFNKTFLTLAMNMFRTFSQNNAQFLELHSQQYNIHKINRSMSQSFSMMYTYKYIFFQIK